MSAPLPRDPDELAELLGELPAVDAALPGRAAELDAAGRAGLDAALARAAIGLLDLTSLDAADAPENARALARHGAEAGVAGVCVWSDRVDVVAEELAGSEVLAVSVAGAFPSSRAPLAVRVAEVEAAVAAGAQEVDVVLDRAALLAGRPGEAFDALRAMVDAAGDVDVKVILETGRLPDAEAVQQAAWIAMAAGARMCKTSTGKDGPGADAVSVLRLIEAAAAFEARTGRAVGVKAAGGIRTAEDAAGLIAIARSTWGEAALDPARLRIGASSLLDALAEAARG